MELVSPDLSTLQIRGAQLRFVTEIAVLVCEQKPGYPVFVPAQKLYGIEWTKPWFKRRSSQRTECFRATTRGAYSITEGPIVDVLQLYQSYIWTLIQTRQKGMACHRDTSVHRLQRFAIFLSLRFQWCIRCGNDFLVLKTGNNPHDVVFHEWFHFLVCSAEEDLSINLFPAVRHLKAFDSFFSLMKGLCSQGTLMTVITEIFVNASLDWRISWLIMTRHVIISSLIHILTVFVVDWFLYSPNVSAIKYVVIISTREVNSWSLMRIWHQLGVSQINSFSHAKQSNFRWKKTRLVWIEVYSWNLWTLIYEQGQNKTLHPTTQTSEILVTSSQEIAIFKMLIGHIAVSSTALQISSVDIITANSLSNKSV